MSIKPVDYNTMIPKTLEISSTKHIENVKNKNIVESGFINQEKIIDRNKSKISNIEKNSNSKIHDNNNSNKREYSENKNKKEKKVPNKEDKSVQKSGFTIDIRI